MNKFEPIFKEGKWLSNHFDTKQDIMIALSVTRPTVDLICSNESSFFKYLPKISKATGVKHLVIVEQYQNIKDGL